jgi:PAS domain S-box-containing protein
MSQAQDSNHPDDARGADPVESARLELERYRTLFVHQGEGIGLVDLGERFVLANPAAERVFGVAPGGLVGRRVTEFLTPEDQVRVQRETERRVAGQTSRYRLRILRPDGEERSLTLTSVPARDEQGRVTGTYGIFLDETERLRTEVELVESQQTLRAVLEATADAILVVDAHGRLVYLNERFIQLWRLGPEVLAALTLEAVRAHILAALEPGSAAAYLEGLEELNRSEREDLRVLQLGDGRVLERYSRPLRGPGGRVWSFRDITARVQSERAYQREVAKLGSMLSNLQEGVLVADVEGRVIELNDSFSALTGLDRTAALGRSLASLTDEPRQAALGEICREVAQHFLGSARSGPVSRLLTLGKRELMLQASAIRRGPGFEGITLGLVDVTELVLARQRAEEVARARSQLVANVSHEIRTPLNGLLGMLALALDQAAEPALRERLELALQSARSLDRLFERLLDFSRPERAGLPATRREPFSPRALLQASADQFAERAAARGLRLGVQAGADLPDRVLGDPAHLGQALAELVDNAVRFTERGEVRMSVTRAGSDSRGELLRFEVADTGPGIPGDLLRAVFQPFFQADGSATRSVGGAGLGLALAARRVRELGGAIQVDSQPGRGSRFWFELPVAPAGEPALDSLDLAGLTDRIQADTDLLRELTQLFAASLPKALAGLRQAAAAADRAALEKGLHELRGAVANLGGRALAAWLERLMARLGAGGELPGQAELNQLERALKGLLGTLEDACAS